MLTVATVFIGLWTLIHVSSFDVREGGLIGETKIPMLELEPKVCRGGVIAGFYGNTCTTLYE